MDFDSQETISNALKRLKPKKENNAIVIQKKNVRKVDIEKNNKDI